MRIPLSLLTAAAVAGAACTAADDADTAAAGADTAAATADTALRLVTTIEGLSGPESALYDATRDVWFITNIDGSPGTKDNNGFIARVSADGVVDSLRFVAGGRNGVTLHAPKGTVIVGDTLWVSDIDALRGFHTGTGAPLATIDFGSRAGFLNDVAAGPDGSIYVTDTGVRFGEDGQMSPTGNDQVFRVAPDRSITTAVRSDSLMAPNGITWDAAGNRLVVVSFQSPTLFHWTPGDSVPLPFASAGGGNDGVELVDGRLLVTSWADSSLVSVENGQAQRLVGGLNGPADIGIDAGRRRVAVPLLPEGRVEVYELPAR